MATIIEFRQSADEVRPRASRRVGRSAEIVIFPGVRYERWGDRAEAASTSVQKSRDVLKLVD
jgi:hypothetical protein